MSNLDYLNSHLFYALVHTDYKQRRRGCKYMGQEPVYRVIKNKSGVSLHRVPSIPTKEFIDKLEKYEYTGLYDCGATKVPMFKAEATPDNE